MEALLSPLGLGLALIWSFAVLASVQLTVRLIMAFSVKKTAIASVVLTAITVPISVAYLYLFGRTLTWMPLAMLVTAIGGYVVADRVLGFRRQRSTIVAAIGIGVLSAPWGALLAPPGH
jgi:putative effector of murein hydrolase